MIKKKVFLLLFILLCFSVDCIGQNVKSDLVRLDTKEMGIDKEEMDIEIVEKERNGNISKLEITDKTLNSACSVITLEMQVIYKIAKLCNYKYFIMLDECELGNNSMVVVIGFTNKRNTNVKNEFGSNFSDKYEDGEERIFASVHSIEWLFGIKTPSSKGICKKK